MVAIQHILLGLALAFLIVPVSSDDETNGNGGGPEPLVDSDGDSIADHNDVCPHDSLNDCVLARSCRFLDDRIDKLQKSSLVFGVVSLIIAIIAFIAGLAAFAWTGPPGAVAGAYATYSTVMSIMTGLKALGDGIEASDLQDRMDELECDKKLGWQE